MPILEISLLIVFPRSPRLIPDTTSFTAIMDSSAVYLHLTPGTDANLRERTWLGGWRRIAHPRLSTWTVQINYHQRRVTKSNCCILVSW